MLVGACDDLVTPRTLFASPPNCDRLRQLHWPYFRRPMRALAARTASWAACTAWAKIRPAALCALAVRERPLMRSAYGGARNATVKAPSK